MEQKDIQQYSDVEFKAAMIATMNLKQEWIASVDFAQFDGQSSKIVPLRI